MHEPKKNDNIERYDNVLSVSLLSRLFDIYVETTRKFDIHREHKTN